MISIYKGNDKSFVFTRKDTDGNVITSAPQDIIFTVKKDFETEIAVFAKVYGNGISQNKDGSWSIHINAEDTSSVAPGEYVCDVKITNEKGQRYHIVKPQKFLIMEVVTK